MHIYLLRVLVAKRKKQMKTLIKFNLVKIIFDKLSN